MVVAPPIPHADIAPAPVPQSPPLGQLPPTVTPTLYDLSLRLVPHETRFDGTVHIAVRLQEPTQTIWLHGQDLHVSDVSVQVFGGAKLAATYKQVTPDGVSRIDTAQPIGPGEATLHLTFDGAYNNQLDGLYRVHDGKEDYVFSQFEAIAARRAFPCFDEPRFKTPFEITLHVPEALQAVSNMPAVGEQTAGDGDKTIVFKPTERLPTYLIAFAVGPFDVVQAADIPANAFRKDAIPLRGIAVRGKGPELAYALGNTGHLLTLLEDYFQVGYPYAKLDIIAVPDFAAGAMENAGAITFRDWYVLLDPNTASSSQVRGCAEVIAHELTHQWFGDLVTMAWWDDLWLNESFATWLGLRTADAFLPGAHLDLEFRQGVLSAMDEDSLASARQIRQPITSTHDIHGAFDAITYQKGGGVLAMFESYLTPERMQAGVTYHLHTYPFGTATATDFLASLATGAKQDVSASFSTFLNQPGVPLIDASYVCDSQGAKLSLSQSRYSPLGADLHSLGGWQVPVCVRYADATGKLTRSCTMLRAAQDEIRLLGCPAWLLPNAGGTGYYRFTLPPTAMQQLVHAPLQPGEKLAVADSINAAFDAGKVDAAEALRNLAPLSDAPERAVAVAPMDLARFTYDELLTDAERPKARAWMRALYGKQLTRLGTRAGTGKNADKGEDGLLRRQVLGFLAAPVADAKVRSALAKMGSELIGYHKDNALHLDAAPADLTDLALSVAAEEHGKAFVDATQKLLFVTDDPGIRRQMLGGLAAIQTPALAEHVRALTLDPHLRTNEVLRILALQVRRPPLRAAAWNWFKANYDAVTARLSINDQGRMPVLVASLCNAELLQDAETFLASHVTSLQGAPRKLIQSSEAARHCIAKVTSQASNARDFFAK